MKSFAEYSVWTVDYTLRMRVEIGAEERRKTKHSIEFRITNLLKNRNSRFLNVLRTKIRILMNLKNFSQNNHLMPELFELKWDWT